MLSRTCQSHRIGRARCLKQKTRDTQVSLSWSPRSLSKKSWSRAEKIRENCRNNWNTSPKVTIAQPKDRIGLKIKSRYCLNLTESCPKLIKGPAASSSDLSKKGLTRDNNSG